jgi:WD40 repeat protein
LTSLAWIKAQQNAVAADAAAKQAQTERDKAQMQLLATRAHLAAMRATPSDDFERAGTLALQSIEIARIGKISTAEPAIEVGRDALIRRPLLILAHAKLVQSLAVTADGRLASAGFDAKIKLWPKGGAGEPVVLSQGSSVLSATLLADGRLATGGLDGKITLWPKEGAADPIVVSSAASLADGRLATGDFDGKIKLWPTNGTGEPVVLSRGSGVLSLAALAEGWLASAGADGTVKLWLIQGEKLIAALCLRAGNLIDNVELARYIDSDTPWQPSCRGSPSQ